MGHPKLLFTVWTEELDEASPLTAAIYLIAWLPESATQTLPLASTGAPRFQKRAWARRSFSAE